MSDKIEEVIYTLNNTIQPISDDYSSDGFLDDFARVDHQHPLSPSLKALLNGSQSSRRNLLDNGAMNICQRPATLAGVINDAGQRVVDRWWPRNNALGTYTYSQTADAPASTEFSSCLKMLCTTADAAPAAADFLVNQIGIEGQFLQHLLWGTTSAKSLTLSFWVKSNVIGTFNVELQNLGGTVRIFTVPCTIKASNTWEYKTITFPGDTGQAITNDNSGRIFLTFWLAVGSNWQGGTLTTNAWAVSVAANRGVGVSNLSATINNFIEFTGLQLEVGSKASIFETRSFDEEYRRCCRYAYVRSPQGFVFAWGQCFTAGNGNANLPLVVPLRTQPTLLATGVAADYAVWNAAAANVACTALPTIGQYMTNGNSLEFRWTVLGGMVAGNITHFFNATVNGSLTFSADI